MKNVVYIFCDELRQDALGCYGNPAGPMKTPNIDSIAQRGVLFENCFCNSPVCVPSRTSLLTGLYPEDTAVYHNEAAFPTFCYYIFAPWFMAASHRHGTSRCLNC